MDNLAQRFLHVNLNCASLDAAERLYAAMLGLTARMRTDPAIATDGSILGLDGETFCTTSFLYDSRGGRGGCALEAVEYHNPALVRDPSTDATRPGIRSALLTVSDLDNAVATLREGGVDVSEPVDGLISGARAVLVLDPDGVVVEIAEAPSEKRGALFAGIRIAAIDAAATGAFLTAIGFTEVEGPVTAAISGAQLAPHGSPDAVECVMARYTLAEDAHLFSVLVVEHPGTRAGEPVPWGGNRQGLYRAALRVENLHASMADLPATVEVMGEPVWCPLPGTKIDGLYISFLRSPDGVVFEFVERPLSFFA